MLPSVRRVEGEIGDCKIRTRLHYLAVCVMSDPKSESPESAPKATAAAAPTSKKPPSADPAASKPADVDERNLVEVDDALAEASFDDRLWLWWQRNGTAVIAGAAAALIVTGIIQAAQLMQQQQLKGMQNDYIEAVGDMDALLAFGQKHSDKPLGAVALLKVADDAFENEDFAAAAEHYRKVADTASELPIGARARLGQAMALISQGGTGGEAGFALLASIAQSETVLPSLRGEAAFRRTILAIEAEDFETAQQFMKTVNEIDDDSIWAVQLKQIADNVPELAKAAEAEASILPVGEAVE